MRRNSPSRSLRHRSPPRRRGRGRSMSPLSRSQPAPPGEERDRKRAVWGGQGGPLLNKQKRFRSRSREWMGHPMDRDQQPFMSLDNDRPPRGRGAPRDKGPKGRDFDKTRDRNREMDMRDGKHKQNRRNSLEHIHPSLDDYEESYLDNHPEAFGANGGMAPSVMKFNTFANSRPHIEANPRNMLARETRHQSPPRDRRPPLRDVRRSPIPTHHGSKGKESLVHSKNESSSDRINRLEKLVEKLVESNAAPGKSMEQGYPISRGKIPELIPSNTKFCTSMWINSVHEECLNKNYDEKSSIRFMQDQMTGIMKAWFKTVAHYDFTWPELKLLITKSFPDNIEFAQTLKLLVLRDKIPEETITQYFFSKVYLCEACKITGQNAVSCLVDGLSNPFMKQEIKSFNFLNPEALYSEYLSKFPDSDIPVRVDQREVREVIPSYPPEEYIPLETENQGLDKGKPFNSRSQGDRKKCFTCKKFGHATVDCRHAPICYRCKKKGHIAVKCPFQEAMLISSNNTVPKSMCWINGIILDGIIDTGSVAVTIRESIIQDMGLMINPTTDILKGYGGLEVIPKGETKIMLKVDKAEKLVKALIIEDKVQTVSVIIGQEFLSQDGVTVMQKNGEITVFDSVP